MRINIKQSGLFLLGAMVAGACFINSCISEKPGRIVRETELRDVQWREFNSIREQFFRTAFYQCLRKSRLEMTCSGCENIYIIVRLTINSDGKVTGYTKVRENVCGGAAPGQLERCFLEYIESITFPDALRSMTIETRLGTGLKC